MNELDILNSFKILPNISTNIGIILRRLWQLIWLYIILKANVAITI